MKILHYNKILNDLKKNQKRIRDAYVNSSIELDDLKDEDASIKKHIQDIELKIKRLKETNKNINNKENLRLINNMFELEKQKYKPYCVRKNDLWNKLTKEQKSDLIKKIY